MFSYGPSGTVSSSRRKDLVPRDRTGERDCWGPNSGSGNTKGPHDQERPERDLRQTTGGVRLV